MILEQRIASWAEEHAVKAKGQAGFRKAFDTVPRAVLWQVLEALGVHGRILEIIKSLQAHTMNTPPGFSTY